MLNRDFVIPDIYTDIMTFQDKKLTTNCKELVIDSIHIAEGYTWEITGPRSAGCKVTTKNIICEGIIELCKGSDLTILRQGTVTGIIDIIIRGSINITEGAKFEISGDGKIDTSSNGSRIEIFGKLNIIDKGILETKYYVNVQQTGMLNIYGDGMWEYGPGNRIIDGTLSISKPENLIPSSEIRRINVNGTLILPQQDEEVDDTRNIILGSDAKVCFYSVGVVGNEIKYVPDAEYTIDHGLTFLNDQNEEIEPEIIAIPPTLTYVTKNPTLNKTGYILDVDSDWLDDISIDDSVDIRFNMIGSKKINIPSDKALTFDGSTIGVPIINHGTLVFK